MKLLASTHHRNGVCGAGFSVSLFTDTDGTTKVLIDFGGDPESSEQDNEYYAVLDVHMLAAGDIGRIYMTKDKMRTGHNKWRGDQYVDAIRKLRKKLEGPLGGYFRKRTQDNPRLAD